MGKWYDYVIPVSMRLKMRGDATGTLDELKEYLQEEYQIIESSHANRVMEALGFDLKELAEEDEEGELTADLELQMAFAESQMDDVDGVEPSEEALEELHDELTAYLEAKYEVILLELLNDALNFYLLGEREEDD
jgi:hypothetical protein